MRHTIGFDGCTLWWIKNWLGGHTQRVVVNSSMSKWRWVRSGISQSLAPGQLSIRVGDTDRGIKCSLRKPADNTQLCGTAGILDERHATQRDLDGLERWPHVSPG